MRPRSRDDFAIAIICALPLEAEAVEALFDETYDRFGKYYSKQRGDANAYINGRIGKHDVVLCYMPGMGKGSAAGVASSLRVSYTGIELALVVGICGGAPPPPKYQEIFLGDVIISDSVIEYDFGRQYPGGFQRKTGVKDTLGRPGPEIRALLNGLRAENARIELQNQTQQYLHILQQRAKWCHPGVSDILFKASYLHKHYYHASPAGCSCLGSDSFDQVCDEICKEALEKDCDDLNCDKGQRIRCRQISEANPTSIYIGPVASADTVMKSGQHRDELVRREKVIGFEMEGAGVWENVPCIIIKGVCDYADSHKSKLWQKYAAATGASAAKAFLENWMPANHKDASRNRHLMIPFARNPHFVGRQEEIQKIEDLVSAPDGPKKLAITGLGGVGKTQLALELAYRIRDREPECSIFWIPCTSHESVEQTCMTIAQMVGIQDVEPAEVKERLKIYLTQTNQKWILIFDNADDMDMWVKGGPAAPPLKGIIPQSENGHVLFTSRNRQLALNLASPNVLSIPDVDQRTAREIFRKLLIRKDLLEDNHVTSVLLEQLAFLPLAISQAVAYINKNSISLARYRSLLGEHEESTIELLAEEFEDDGRYAQIQNPIQQLDEEASNYLSFMACISPRDIPESILPSTTSAKRRVEALGVDDSFLSLHRLVHLATRNWLRKREAFETWIQRTADQLDKIFPKYLPHALYLVDSAEFRARQDNHEAFLARAETLFQDVLRVRERACGPEHPYTLTSETSHKP
ncbi:putative kinesin light chain [Aspergillus desertorum]